MNNDQAKKWVKDKANQDKVLKEFFEKHPPTEAKIAFFMAGIPGAGKTEFAKNIINDKEPKLIPIEHDELVTYIDGYKPEEYYNYRTAGSTLVTLVLEVCLKNGYGFIFDGTLSHDGGYRNVRKTLKKDYTVFVVYIVQTAQTAWGLTKDRDLTTKRAIEINGFIKTCNKINQNLKHIFDLFKDELGFNFWTFDKKGKVKPKTMKPVFYSHALPSPEEIEAAKLAVELQLSLNYNTEELE